MTHGLIAALSLLGGAIALWWSRPWTVPVSFPPPATPDGDVPAAPAFSAIPIPPAMDGAAVDVNVQRFAHAIAVAEGYGVPGSIPTRANNPGDLVLPGWTGPSLGAQRISVFPSEADGWNHLYHQLLLIREGRSRVYTPSMTIRQMAERWTGTQQPEWARNVADALGVPVSTSLQTVFDAA